MGKNPNAANEPNQNPGLAKNRTEPEPKKLWGWLMRDFYRLDALPVTQPKELT